MSEFTKPEKPYVLIGKDGNGCDVITWHDTEEDLLWCVENNKAVDAYDAFEIGSSRDIDIKNYEELRTCSCGGRPIIEISLAKNEHRIFCRKCGTGTFWHDSQSNIVNMWNRG